MYSPYVNGIVRKNISKELFLCCYFCYESLPFLEQLNDTVFVMVWLNKEFLFNVPVAVADAVFPDLLLLLLDIVQFLS